MKREIALLLVLAMVLSLVPANLFAQPARMGTVSDLITQSSYGNAAEGRAWGRHPSGNEFNNPALGWDHVLDTVTVSVDMFRLRNLVAATPAGFNFRIELTEGAEFPDTNFPGWSAYGIAGIPHEFRALQSNSEMVFAGGFGNAIAGISVSFLRISGSVGIINMVYHNPDGTGRFPGNMDGFLEFTMPIARVRNDQAHLVLRATNNPGAPELVNARIAAFPGRGIEIVEGDVVYFETVARLNHIRVNELAANAITDGVLYDMAGRSFGVLGFPTTPAPFGARSGVPNLAVRFTAPANYFWSTGGTPALGVSVPQPIVLTGDYFTATTYMNGGRHELLIVISNPGRTSVAAIAALLGSYQFENLRLVPGENAPLTGEVRIDIRVGRIVTVLGGGGATAGCGTTGVTPPGVPVGPDGSIWLCPCGLANCPIVGCTCATAGLVRWEPLRGPGAPQPIRTNVLVARRVVSDLTLETYGDELPELRSGYVSAHIVDPTQAFVTGTTAQVLLRENVPGALGLGLGHPIHFSFPEGVQVMGVRYRLDGPGGWGDHGRFNWDHATGTNNGWHLRGIAANVNPFVTVGANHVTIRHDVASATVARTLQVEFRVSVEAGFEHKFGDVIPVEVTGSGVAALVDNTVDVAEVWDPVTVVLEGDPIELEFVGRENNIPRTPLGDIVITETRPGALTVGSNLWIHLERQLLPRPWDITLIEGTILVDPVSGLAVTVTRNHQVTSAGQNTLVLQLTVISASHTEDREGVITLGANEVFGIVYYDEIYSIVVTGNAVAQNHNFVANVGLPLPGAPVNPLGTFNTAPYSAPIFAPIERDTGLTPGNRANSLAGVRFSPEMNIGGVTPPVLWERLPGMAYEAGFVAARSFAVTAGVTDDNIIWSAGVATLSGWDYQGQWVTVILTQGSATATIVRNGVPGTVDIAEFAEGQSGPAGTVVPLFRHDRIYLPFRFLFNAFGYSNYYTLTREGNAAVISAR